MDPSVNRERDLEEHPSCDEAEHEPVVQHGPLPQHEVQRADPAGPGKGVDGQNQRGPAPLRVRRNQRGS